MVAAHQCHNKTKHTGFDKAGHHIEPGEEIPGIVEVGDRREIEGLHAHRVAAENTDDIAYKYQAGQHEGGSQHAREEQIFEWIGGECHQRIDLFGDPHGANFGSKGGTDAPGNHQARHDRA